MEHTYIKSVCFSMKYNNARASRKNVIKNRSNRTYTGIIVPLKSVQCMFKKNEWWRRFPLAPPCDIVSSLYIGFGKKVYLYNMIQRLCTYIGVVGTRENEMRSGVNQKYDGIDKYIIIRRYCECVRACTPILVIYSR